MKKSRVVIFVPLIVVLMCMNQTVLADTSSNELSQSTQQAVSAALNVGLIPVDIGGFGFLHGGEDGATPEEGSIVAAAGAAFGIERVTLGAFRIGGMLDYAYNFGKTIEAEHESEPISGYAHSLRLLLEVGQGLRIGKRVEVGYRFGTGPALFIIPKKETWDETGVFSGFSVRATIALSVALNENIALFIRPSFQLSLLYPCSEYYRDSVGLGISAPIVLGVQWLL